VARPDTHVGDVGGDDGQDQAAAEAGADVVRPATDVVRPGTGVVAPADGSAAKARAAVPDAPERPLDPIHIVLPVIPVKPAKQGFLDRLVAPKKKRNKDKEVDEEPDELEAPIAPPSAPPPAPSAPAPASTAPPLPAPPPSPTAPPTPAPVRVQPRGEPRSEAPPWAASAPPAAPPMRPPGGPPRTLPQKPGPWAPGSPGRQPSRRPGPDFPAGRRGRPAAIAERYEGWDNDVSDQRRPRLGRWLAGAAVVTVLAVVAGAVVGLLGGSAPPRWLGTTGGTVEVPPVMVGLGTDAPAPSSIGISARIHDTLGDARLGGHVTVSVVDVVTGESLFDQGGNLPATPASTAKLATAAAVLHARGPAYRIPTRVVTGAAPGDVVLLGGGDPTLAAGANGTYPGAARLDELADQVVKALGGTPPTRVIVDSTLFEGPTMGPSWFAQDLKDGFVANITALMTDGARRNPRQMGSPAARYAQPDLAAGQLFARAFGLPTSAVSFGNATAGAGVLGEVLSPPVSRLVEMMLLDSDNIIAEALARQVALARGQPASFDGAAAATRDVLSELSIPTDGFGLVDGSGLSHVNKVSAQLLTAILSHAASANQPELRAIVTGLPVAAYSGTLATRYRTSTTGGSAAGVVRAKTGTLSGVNALAGIAVDADGRLLAFSIVADATANLLRAEYALDRVAAAIASCGCP
jgi:serine-type D-Ala-D-Ala carboxypeptidase/endopeptidase (penicillin-binding protein 4)